MSHALSSKSNVAMPGPLRPRRAEPARPVAVPVAEPQESLLMEYLRLLQRHRWAIIGIAFAGCVAALLLSMLVRPVYHTRTSVDIEGLNGDFMNIREVARTGSGGPDSNEVTQQTQIKLLQSQTLMDSTTAALLRAGDPRDTSKPDPLSRLAAFLHLPGHTQLPYEDVVRDTAERVKVKPLGLTRLVELSCDGYRADVAAAYCNRLIREFESEDIETRAEEAQKTSTWLTRQLADVRLKAQESQRALQAAVGGNGLMLSQQTSSTGEERLREVQQELVKAQADRMQKESDSSVARIARADTAPGVQDNPLYRQYEARLADLQGKLAEMVPGLTEQNPKVIKLRSQIHEAEAGLAASRSSSAGLQSNELAAARHREELLQVAYNAQLANVSSDLQRAAQVSLLRREVDAEQQLYQTMLQRAKEAGFASAMQASTVRVVDPAVPPASPSSPRRAVDGTVGFLLSGLFGAGFFFYRDRTQRVFRLPGEAQTLLQVPELGVIPHAVRLGRSVAQSSAQPAESGTLRLNPTGGTKLGEAIALTRWDERFSIVAEAYRSTTFSLLLADAKKSTKIYALSSPGDSEGKTTVVSNLGVALSRTRLRVLLIDGDLRKPRLHTSFSMRSDFGLRNLLRGEVDLAHAPASQLYRESPLPNLALIPAGRGAEDSVELLHSPNLERLLHRLRSEFDIILVDTPPMLHMADARVLADQCDGGILILRANSTGLDQAQAARDLFDSDGIPILGTILNDFDPAREGLSDFYQSYERYQSDDAEREVASI